MKKIKDINLKEKSKEALSKGKGFFKEFKEFITKGNALALAIGVIIGSCFTNIVNSISNDILMPVIGAIGGGSDFKGWRTPLWNASIIYDASGNATLDEFGQVCYTNAIYWGRFIQAVLDFLLTALVLFLIIKLVAKVTSGLGKAKDKVIDKLHHEESAPAEEATEEKAE